LAKDDAEELKFTLGRGNRRRLRKGGERVLIVKFPGRL